MNAYLSFSRAALAERVLPYRQAVEDWMTAERGLRQTEIRKYQGSRDELLADAAEAKENNEWATGILRHRKLSESGRCILRMFQLDNFSRQIENLSTSSHYSQLICILGLIDDPLQKIDQVLNAAIEEEQIIIPADWISRLESFAK